MESDLCLDDADGGDYNDVEKLTVEDRRKVGGIDGFSGANTSDSHGLEGSGDDNVLECPVCLQTCIYPVQLPCRHIFCFLCVKGVANRSKRCALCRQQIPPDFFCRPNLVRRDDLEQPVTFDDGYSWFYEGVNGWWQYDDRTSKELEGHHKAGHPSCELLIAGYVYIIDLTNMVQCRRNDRTRKRRIKRDLVNLAGRKGVAGLKIPCETPGIDSDRPGAEGHENASGLSTTLRRPIPIQQVDRSGDHQSLSPPTPNNTPQTPMTPSESPPNSATTERDLSVHLERLRLVDSSSLSISPQGGSTDSSRGYDTPEQLSTSLEDATRLENVRASLQQLQSQSSLRGRNIDLDDTEGGNNSDCDTSVVHV
ncbi:E3 ubiquitin-protein ligase rnf146-like isoform X1 [Biomphalaria glabrata]|uniref:E3 ubiquitin-protein ligase n=1 Tax=Biomphalaria glabrata TaxID=6526 RepID=A0A2C9JHN4_BIOGL|nr:E3 ubiquitin-protein ligase rnf146-like isoform X1 [Biomphalaria glabrata]